MQRNAGRREEERAGTEHVLVEVATTFGGTAEARDFILFDREVIVYVMVEKGQYWHDRE